MMKRRISQITESDEVRGASASKKPNRSTSDILHVEDKNENSDADTEIADEEPSHHPPTVYLDPNIRLMRVNDLPNHQNVWSKSLSDLFRGDLECMLQLNYMFQLSWMMSHLPVQSRTIPITVVHGLRGMSQSVLQSESLHFPSVRIIFPHLPIAYGTHHTKAMFLIYRSGHLRVVIHTANMISQDWGRKTQGIWTSPLLPKKSSDAPNSTSAFERDLLQYISAYDGRLSTWHKRLAEYDYSSCKATLIASAPGRHTGDALKRWGHLRLRECLADIAVPDDCRESSTVVCQFSSIGSLGPTDAWLANELGLSLSAASNTSEMPDLRLVFPTVENVRTSLEGWDAGESIPFNSKNWNKQKGYMRPRLCQWSAKRAGRERAMPHIKTFTRVSPTGTIAWFLLTSSNLSKAAWGSFEKGGTQLMIRSYELGVLLAPHHFQAFPGQRLLLRNVTPDVAPNIDLVASAPSTSNAGDVVVPIRLPYDLPLVPYEAEDEPWTVDLPRSQVDSVGRRKL
ncbi:tyrosyl-DNA phosphodiesterase 1 [Gaertneriomyces sp. JEL0708]|nr:tyrosyl-DNA phosphodiesterase 1 [Gaertneriomyces sp. JEL0708]